MGNGFEPSRLTIARKRRSLSKKVLAERAGVSARMLTDYENGVAEPSPSTMCNLAGALEYPEAFFAGPPIEELTVDAVSFRALTKMKAAQRDAALSSGAMAVSLHRWIRSRFALPATNVPSLPDCNDPEVAAELVRQAWGIGQRPIPNMVHLLEAHGVRVFTLSEKCVEVDAYSCWVDDEAFVFLNTQKSGERSRMDAAHELGHLVMHRLRESPQGRDAEREAKAFASAFLMPRDDVISVMQDYPTPDLDELVRLKLRWQVSVAALVYRLNRLGLLTEWHNRNLWIAMSAAEMRSREPEEISRETSQVLRKVFEALRADGTGIGDLARQLMVPTDELSSLLVGLVLVPVSGTGASGTSQGTSPRLRLV
ncbi:MAG: XRE family transcriptional regulator [Solirubrobacterales bacterium]